MWKKYENEELKRGTAVKAGIYSKRLVTVEITAPDSRKGKWWAWDDVNRLEVMVDQSIIEYIFTGTESAYEEERLEILENRAKRHNASVKAYYKAKKGQKSNLTSIWSYF